MGTQVALLFQGYLGRGRKRILGRCDCQLLRGRSGEELDQTTVLFLFPMFLCQEDRALPRGLYIS